MNVSYVVFIYIYKITKKYITTIIYLYIHMLPFTYTHIFVCIQNFTLKFDEFIDPFYYIMRFFFIIKILKILINEDNDPIIKMMKI